MKLSEFIKFSEDYLAEVQLKSVFTKSYVMVVLVWKVICSEYMKKFWRCQKLAFI